MIIKLVRHFCLFLLLLRSTASRDTNKLQLFLAWASNNSIHHPSIAISSSNNSDLFLQTTTSLRPNDVLVRVPRHLIWTGRPESSISTPDATHDAIQIAVDQQTPAIQTYLRSNTQCLMAVKLLYERKLGPSSFWEPYISMLPHTVRLPVHFQDELLDIPNNAVFALNQRKQKKILRAIYELLSAPDTGVYFQLDPPLDTSTFEDFLDAWSVVASRSFMLDDGKPALVPFSDFANHNNKACDVAVSEKKSNDNNVDTMNEDSRIVGSAYHGNTLHSDFVMKATRAFQQGEPVHVCYHRHASNSMTLANWAFTTTNNSRDYVLISAIDECGEKGTGRGKINGPLKCSEESTLLSKLIMEKLSWTNTCLFSQSLSLSNRTFGIGLVVGINC